MLWTTRLGLFFSITIFAFVWKPHFVFAESTKEEQLQQIEQKKTPEETSGIGERLSFYGYGELEFNNPKVGEASGFPAGNLNPTLDFHRLVLGWSYAFTDRLSLHTEVEWEHAGTEIELEYAYLEYEFNDAVHLRVGSLLMPFGPLNEFHEPINYYSIQRPYTETYIIPTTWQQAGIGIAGQGLMGLNYRVYFVEGLDATLFSSYGIKESNQVLSEDSNKAFNFGGVGRLEYTGFPGFAVGTSIYSAGAAQGDPTIGHAQVTMWDADLRYRVAGFDFTGVYVHTWIGGADRISAVVGETIGSQQIGWYVEGAYHLGQLINSPLDLVPFVRWEDIDTQAGITALNRTPGTDRQVLTTGLAFYPHHDVAIKADYERWHDDTDDTAARYNLGIAFEF